jgi:hypothetical protein
MSCETGGYNMWLGIGLILIGLIVLFATGDVGDSALVMVLAGIGNRLYYIDEAIRKMSK